MKHVISVLVLAWLTNTSFVDADCSNGKIEEQDVMARFNNSFSYAGIGNTDPLLGVLLSTNDPFITLSFDTTHYLQYKDENGDPEDDALKIEDEYPENETAFTTLCEEIWACK
jgi:hypothetical protein